MPRNLVWRDPNPKGLDLLGNFIKTMDPHSLRPRRDAGGEKGGGPVVVETGAAAAAVVRAKSGREWERQTANNVYFTYIILIFCG